MSTPGTGNGSDARAFLRIEDLTKKFDSFVALKNISLEIFEGEFVCFLGPSGCGKTTLLRAIAGLDIQSSGRIWQAGQDISALPPSERDFGIVFQSYALFPNLTVTRNVGYGLENRRTSRSQIQARVTELLELVGLPEQGDKYPAQLSGGQQQRIALARAIATSPGLLLLDEPLSALDAKVRVHLRHEVKQLQIRLGITTVMVTHDQEEALTMADRIVVMNHGVVEQIGTPLEIYRDPATAFVADFIGTMNFVPGCVTAPGKVRIGSVMIHCATDGAAADAAITVALRPEDIVVQESDGTPENSLAVQIKAMEFLGSFYRAEIGSDGLGDARLQADFSINLVRRRAIKVGDILPVVLPQQRIRIYPGSVSDG